MNWLIDVITHPSVVQTIIVISVISALGLQLGKLKIFNISLGITFVFFVGILVGNIGLNFNQDMLLFAQNFGLVLFIYSLGLQVGPGFFPSLKKGGLKLNLMSLTIVMLGIVQSVVLYYSTKISLPDMIGILSGAVTNTPALGAAQEALRQIAPNDTQHYSEMALACAVTYPFGVVGVILVIVFLRARIAPKNEVSYDAKNKDKTTFVTEFMVTNPGIAGKTIKDIMKHANCKFVISRIWREGKVTIPTSDSVLNINDHILVISTKGDVENIHTLVGDQVNTDWNKEDIDWNHIDNSMLASRKIIVTQNKLNGVKLGALRLRNRFNINITRIDRAGIDLLASPNLALQIGDQLTVVGEKNEIDAVANLLGNEVKRLVRPNLIGVFIGLALGLLLGSIPFYIPGMSIPVKLGIAGGPIIVGIIIGAFGPRFHITTYMTQSANLMLRQLGLIMYLACLGLSAGESFFDVVVHGAGLQWIFTGMTLTLVPIVIMGILSIKVFNLDYGKTIGMICGSMANPIALDFANSTVDGDEPAVAYATVYPMTMFARIIMAQLTLLFFI